MTRKQSQMQLDTEEELSTPEAEKVGPMQHWIERERVERWHRTRDFALAGLLANPAVEEDLDEIRARAREVADDEHGPLPEAKP